MKKEACVTNVQQAVSAERLGADQLELCVNLSKEGLTPSYALAAAVIAEVSIPTKLMINPFAFDYCYQETSRWKQIKQQILDFEELAHAGIVIGPITLEKEPDLKTLEKVRCLTNRPITFHRAIELAESIPQFFKTLVTSGLVDFILTSGGQGKAMDNTETLVELKSLATNATQLIAGGGVTADNLLGLHEACGLKLYHGTKIVGDLGE